MSGFLSLAFPHLPIWVKTLFIYTFIYSYLCDEGTKQSLNSALQRYKKDYTTKTKKTASKLV